MIDRELEGKLAGELDRVRRFLAGGWMGNRNGGRVIGRGLDGRGVVGGEIGRDANQGVGGENWSFGGKMLAGSVTEGGFIGMGMAGKKMYGYWQGVGGRISVSNNICM